MTSVDSAATEIAQALSVARPQLLGLQFLLRLDQAEATKRALELARDDTARRIQLLEAAEQTLHAVVADGYPDVPVREVPDTVLTDLDDDLSVEQAARALFATDKAVKLNVSVGTPEPKDAA